MRLCELPYSSGEQTGVDMLDEKKTLKTQLKTPFQQLCRAEQTAHAELISYTY